MAVDRPVVTRPPRGRVGADASRPGARHGAPQRPLRGCLRCRPPGSRGLSAPGIPRTTPGPRGPSTPSGGGCGLPWVEAHRAPESYDPGGRRTRPLPGRQVTKRTRRSGKYALRCPWEPGGEAVAAPGRGSSTEERPARTRLPSREPRSGRARGPPADHRVALPKPASRRAPAYLLRRVGGGAEELAEFREHPDRSRAAQSGGPRAPSAASGRAGRARTRSTAPGRLRSQPDFTRAQAGRGPRGLGCGACWGAPGSPHPAVRLAPPGPRSRPSTGAQSSARTHRAPRASRNAGLCVEKPKEKGYRGAAGCGRQGGEGGAPLPLLPPPPAVCTRLVRSRSDVTPFPSPLPCRYFLRRSVAGDHARFCCSPASHGPLGQASEKEVELSSPASRETAVEPRRLSSSRGTRAPDD